MKTLLETTDAVFGFCCDKIPGKGEDSWYYSVNEKCAVIGVFDGCGGLGAARYDRMKDHTGAWLASRTASACVNDWFTDSMEKPGFPDWDKLKEMMTEYLSSCLKMTGQAGTKLYGSMVRQIPTTAAVWLVYQQGQNIIITSVSAGDSRNYILDTAGIGQISRDDINGEDAFSNLYNDGVMTNVLAADGKFQFNIRTAVLQQPSVLISATDGIFGYRKSPMEFEYWFLRALMEASSIDQWTDAVKNETAKIAGDDYTFAALSLGFGSFDELKKRMRARYGELSQMMREIGQDPECRLRIWESDKARYYRYAEGGVR